MNRFAALLDRLAYEPSRNAKLRLMSDYFRTTPDPERGYALAAITGALSFRHAKPGIIRALIAERTDEVLFALSWDYVGDLSETVALMWPAHPRSTPLPLRSDGEGPGGGWRAGGGVGGGGAAQQAPLLRRSLNFPPPLTSPPHALRAWVEGSARRLQQRQTAPIRRRCHTSSPRSRRSASPSCPPSSPLGSMPWMRPAAGRCSSLSPARCASAYPHAWPRPRSRGSAAKSRTRSN